MMTDPRQSILKVLAYYDIFKYPLTKEEIWSFLEQPILCPVLDGLLQELTDQQIIYKCGEYYSIPPDEALRTRRLAGNQKAQTQLPKAIRIASFLYQFPFVRGIGISGSLSKNFADDKSDFDFFIITSANRLWIARTIMHFFKKLTFLTGHQHWFCMNYFIDEEALQIEEQNIFTATELVTLVPVCGATTLDEFYISNRWTSNYFPNSAFRKTVQPERRSWYKKAWEWVLNNPRFDALDNYLMRLTTKRWNQKEQEYRLNMRGFRMGLRNAKHYSKPNPVFFQHKILTAHQQKMEQLNERLMLLHRVVV